MTAQDSKFLLDANVLISAHRSYYGFDLCPGFWNAVKTGHAAGRIFSTRRVLLELKRGADIMVDWVESELPEGFFLDDSDLTVISEYAPMMQWVQAGPITLRQKPSLPAMQTVGSSLLRRPQGMFL